MEQSDNLEQIEILLRAFVRRLSENGHHHSPGAMEAAVSRFVVRSLVSEANDTIRRHCRAMSEAERDRLLYSVQLRYPVLHHLRMLLHPVDGARPEETEQREERSPLTGHATCPLAAIPVR